MKGKIIKIIFGITACVMLFAVLAGVICLRYFRKSDGFVQFDSSKLNQVYTALTVLDDDGQALAEPLYINNYKQIPLAALHDYTYNAFVAVEDKRFFSHHGIDERRIVGALLHNLRSRSYKEGASTISQQLIKNTHLDNSKTIRRKINEMMLAKELEKAYSKEEILEMYINTIYFGRNAYGIESAANVYFNKSASELSLAESAVLAGMIKAPNVYAPDKNTDRCKSRRDTVLRLMLEQEFVDFDEFDSACKEEIHYCPQTLRPERNYMYLVMQEACRLLNMTPQQLAKSDFVIETYYDPEIQRQLVDMARSDSTMTSGGDPADLSAILLDNCGGIEACILKGETAGTRRQVGSALKPIAVYAPALNEKIITQASPILDEETDFNGYRPTNASGYNGWTTVKYAVAKSLNVPAVKTLNALTLPISEQYLEQFGISGKQDLSLALGNAQGGMDIFTLAKCYATLANDGRCNDIGFIKNIYSTHGLIYTREPKNKRIFRSGANYLMTDMLVNTVNVGTAKALKNGKYQIAAKTGTVGDQKGNTDALVAGYTTEHTFVSWYSGDLPNSVNGATAPCEFSQKLLKYVYAKHTPTDFLPPSSVVRLDIDKDDLYDNQLVTKCDSGEKFWFDIGNQPKQTIVKERYDYVPDIHSDSNRIQVTLPQTDGEWRLYRRTESGNELLSMEKGEYRCTIDADTTFFAELYKKNKLVYTTPPITVYFCESDTTPRHFPDLTDFWYWG